MDDRSLGNEAVVIEPRELELASTSPAAVPRSLSIAANAVLNSTSCWMIFLGNR